MINPADVWIIVLGRGIKLIGRMVPETIKDRAKQKGSFVELQPCFELVDMKLPTQNGIVNMVSVQPIADIVDSPCVRLSLDDPSPTIMVDELSDTDRDVMKQRIRECLVHCDERRAARSGIVIAGKDQIPK